MQIRKPDPKQLRIISGGQTGVDRAALDVALELGLPCGGWCPHGRRSEDGRIPERYPLQETRSTGYAERTELNVREADATLVLYLGGLSGGTRLTVTLARSYGKPFLTLDLAGGADAGKVAEWLAANEVTVLNVAGPRESQAPGIHVQAGSLLREVLSRQKVRNRFTGL